MSIKVQFDSNVLSYDYQCFDGTFKLRSSEDDEIIIIESPLKLDSTFEMQNKIFDVYFLAKKDIKENDIFRVFLDKKRIGWIIPTNSLDSNQHDYSSNEHYLKYAYIGARESLKKADESIYLKTADYNSGTIKFSDIFHESTALFIISKETLDDDFDLDRASPSLIKYGYVKLSTINPDEIQFIADLPNKEGVPDKNKIDLYLTSKLLENYKIISEILNLALTYENKAVFKFFFVYQIFEILIDNIYKDEQEILINDLISVKGDVGKTKDVLAEISSFTSEKTRFGLLIDKYTKVKSDLGNLKICCNNLLKLINKKEGNEFKDYFYSIRNFIFHQYRDFPKLEGDPVLNDIVKEVIDILPKILNTYKNTE